MKGLKCPVIGYYGQMAKQEGKICVQLKHYKQMPKLVFNHA